MELKIVKEKEPELKFKKELEVSIHKRNFTVSPKVSKVTFYSKPDADILGKRKSTVSAAKGKDLKADRVAGNRHRLYRNERYHKDRAAKGRSSDSDNTRMAAKSDIPVMDTPEEMFRDAAVLKNEAAKKKFKRSRQLKSVSEPAKSYQKGPNLAVKGVKSGGTAILTQMEGGEETNEALHLMGTASRPVERIAEKRKYQRAEKKLRVKKADGKITSRQSKKEMQKSKKKTSEKQKNQAVRQRKMQYVINKLTGSGEQDSLIQTVKDIARIKFSFVMVKVVEVIAALLAPLFALFLTAAIPAVIIALLFYASPVAAFMPAPSDNPTVREVLSSYYMEFNAKLAEGGDGESIEYLHNDNGIM